MGKVLERFSDKEMNEMHLAFLKKVGGTTDEKKSPRIPPKAKINPPHQKNEFPLMKRLWRLSPKNSLPDIAQKRGMTLGTIISHLEKLKARDSSLNLSPYKPKERDLKVMSDAFKNLGKQKFLPSTEC